MVSLIRRRIQKNESTIYLYIGHQTSWKDWIIRSGLIHACNVSPPSGGPVIDKMNRYGKVIHHIDGKSAEDNKIAKRKHTHTSL